MLKWVENRHQHSQEHKLAMWVVEGIRINCLQFVSRFVEHRYEGGDMHFEMFAG